MTNSFSFNFESRLANRVILVAGATGGLGSAATALLSRDGATVVGGYRGDRQRAVELQRFIKDRYDKQLHLVEGDVSDANVRQSYLSTADSVGDGLYGLVCFTGDPARVKFDEVTDSQMQESVQKNYIAPVLLARDAAALMMKRGIEGSVVLISTMQAVAPFDSSINYAGPKTALIQAGRIMAKQWGGPGGVREIGRAHV